ncbi:hypothetical protein KIPB_000418 [Kipferlia bialata]|uniref:Uncharacterized protein n=1 Tax=Kipferlia bialata TaxID=797122 RepID=A0A9K3CMA7_9EUKA|nr:hypothetical protein KIPB_000418 [Kipferlia bialata]|eukprot:g418.t1
MSRYTLLHPLPTVDLEAIIHSYAARDTHTDDIVGFQLLRVPDIDAAEALVKHVQYLIDTVQPTILKSVVQYYAVGVVDHTVLGGLGSSSNATFVYIVKELHRYTLACALRALYPSCHPDTGSLPPACTSPIYRDGALTTSALVHLLGLVSRPLLSVHSTGQGVGHGYFGPSSLVLTAGSCVLDSWGIVPLVTALWHGRGRGEGQRDTAEVLRNVTIGNPARAGCECQSVGVGDGQDGVAEEEEESEGFDVSEAERGLEGGDAQSVSQAVQDDTPHDTLPHSFPCTVSHDLYRVGLLLKSLLGPTGSEYPRPLAVSRLVDTLLSADVSATSQGAALTRCVEGASGRGSLDREGCARVHSILRELASQERAHHRAERELAGQGGDLRLRMMALGSGLPIPTDTDASKGDGTDEALCLQALLDCDHLPWY